MLACARIGAMHSVVFGGFSAMALADRIADGKSKILITADGGFRRGKVVPLKDTADAALKNCPTVEKSIVVRRTGEKVAWQEGRDFWWNDLEKEAAGGMPRACRSIPSSRCTFCTRAARRESRRACCTRPRDTCCNACGARALVFDLRDDDVYWCTADIGWVTGHSYMVYGPLANGATW